jgi:CRISPR-associated protein Cmr4
MERKAYLLHALSPLHAGTGHAADVIDLPIARMKATNIPIVPGSSIKGVLRDALRPASSGANDAEEKWLATFGPDGKKVDAAEHAGALVVGEARLLALPVRSFRGTFAYVTSPLLLRLAKRDLGAQHTSKPVPELAPCTVKVRQQSAIAHDGKVYLQDLDLTLDTRAQSEQEVTAWTEWLAPLICGTDDILSKRFAIVDDETMSFLWDTATQLDQRVRINEGTRTVDRGALWLEESLPAETVLIGLMEADRSRRGAAAVKDWTADKVLKFALAEEATLQFGGKASTGRGRCRLLPVA